MELKCLGVFVASGLAIASQCGAATPTAAAKIALGSSIFQQHCSLCHDNSMHMINDIGPALFGVVGRRVGSVGGYDYSPILLKANADGEVWSEAKLDVFLTNPQHAKPGTGMPMFFPKRKDRQAIVAYLRTLHPRP